MQLPQLIEGTNVVRLQFAPNSEQGEIAVITVPQRSRHSRETNGLAWEQEALAWYLGNGRSTETSDSLTSRQPAERSSVPGSLYSLRRIGPKRSGGLLPARTYRIIG